jgi:cytochrome c55X
MDVTMPRGSRRRWRWWRSAPAIGFALALQSAFAAEPGLDPAKLTNLVRQDCGSCHGLTLKGGLGKPLTTNRLQQWDRAQLIHIILDGVPGTPMPGWRPVLTEAEASWIADVLKEGSLQ